jgi:hypothetical protein
VTAPRASDEFKTPKCPKSSQRWPTGDGVPGQSGGGGAMRRHRFSLDSQGRWQWDEIAGAIFAIVGRSVPERRWS